jgi:hypothetical protein
MAQKTDAELLSQKEIIKNETANKANTALRIGQMHEDVIDSKMNNVDAYTKPFPQVTASGTDTYTATLSPAITAYAVGQKFQILFTNANTGAATLALNGLAALTITKNGATALSAGDIPAGSIKLLAYDGTRLQIVGDGGGGGSVQSVTGDGVDNTDPDNPVIDLSAYALLTDLTAAKSIMVAVTDEVTNIGTGTALVSFRMPYALTLTAVRASLVTAQASGNIFTVDINEAGTTILSTKLTIDNTETTSVTAVTPPVISDTALADDALITVDVDQIGDGSAIGLKITLIGT